MLKTIRSILVPLDGSERAEMALPFAARIARTTQGTIILLRVLNFTTGNEVLSQEDQVAFEAEVAEAEKYLTDLISQSEDLKGIETRIEVFSRNESAAKTILVSAQTNEVDLIVLCSHGQTGSERWALGSVAQKIVRHSEKPVLLVREDSPKPEKPIHALVPLDGSSFAETVLVPAAHLVAALSEKGTGVLHLVQVIDLPEDTSQQVIKLPVPEEQFKDLPEEPAVDEAITYLAGVTGTLKSNLAEIYHLDVYGYIAPGKDAADRIVEMAEAEVAAIPGGFDLIALATHGRGGVLHWVLGSVTERVLSASKLPTLIVRPHKVLTD